MNLAAAAGVFECLVDGRRCKPDQLATAAGLDPAALPAVLAVLEDSGLALERVDGCIGLGPNFDRLDAERICAALDPAIKAVTAVDVLPVAGSSNDVLLAEPPPVPGEMSAAIVEFQHGGRGRRGRGWIAPPGGALCLSVAWRYATLPQPLSALSLVVAVAALRALARVARIEVGVKWPNDLAVAERKLGGILVEVRTVGAGVHVVAGIGINVRVPAERLARLSDWPQGAIDLAAAGARDVARNDLAAALIVALHAAFAQFADAGFAPFASEWNRAHLLNGREASLTNGESVESGTVLGIDDAGALLLEQGGRVRRVIAGDLSLRSIG